MKNLNICIDIDGTITDPYYWLYYANKYFNLNISEDDVTDYEIAKVLNIEKEDYNKFYEENKFIIHSRQMLRNDFIDVIERIYAFNNIYFVTARDKSLELLTNLYLKYHKISYDGVWVLGNTNKVPIAQKLNCNIFIEDSYDNAVELSSNGFKVLLIDTNYNRLSLNDNIIRVYNWNEILQIISDLSKEQDVI